MMPGTSNCGESAAINESKGRTNESRPVGCGLRPPSARLVACACHGARAARSCWSLAAWSLCFCDSSLPRCWTSATWVCCYASAIPHWALLDPRCLDLAAWPSLPLCLCNSSLRATFPASARALCALVRPSPSLESARVGARFSPSPSAKWKIWQPHCYMSDLRGFPSWKFRQHGTLPCVLRSSVPLGVDEFMTWTS